MRSLKKVDPKALMKKAARCGFLFPPAIDGQPSDECTEPARWYFEGVYLCRPHAEMMLGAALVRAAREE